VTILAITGMIKEAGIIGTAGVVVVVGGGDGDGLAQKLDALHGDIGGVISIGLGGALSPLLKVGDVVIGEKIITGTEDWECHAGWRNRLASRLAHAHQGLVFGSDVIIHQAETKTGLYNTTGALVVDMESQVAARFAAKRNLPLAALRVISDGASHVLPPAALVAMRPDGGISIAKVLWSVMKKPAQIPALVRTGRASSKAFAELLRCRDLCGVGIAGLDL
jgi:adenosylhomocysteine nucleosidase